MAHAADFDNVTHVRAIRGKVLNENTARFIQDETSGVFVENLSTNRPDVGDVVEISGVSHPGAFAPIISRPKWAKVGTAPLPNARLVPIEQIMSGAEDGQRVEVVGIVRAVEPGPTNFDLD